jgi:hypothetical protein
MAKHRHARTGHAAPGNWGSVYSRLPLRDSFANGSPRTEDSGRTWHRQEVRAAAGDGGAPSDIGAVACSSSAAGQAWLQGSLGWATGASPGFRAGGYAGWVREWGSVGTAKYGVTPQSSAAPRRHPATMLGADRGMTGSKVRGARSETARPEREALERKGVK